jgi:drug/metabolite transporter (DMT)-like permease
MMCGVGAVFATVYAVLTSPLPAAAPSPSAWAAVSALGVFSSALGSVGYVYLVQRRGPVFMSMSIYLAPLWATGLGVAVLGERPGWSTYLALALILAGVGLTTARDRRTRVR